MPITRYEGESPNEPLFAYEAWGRDERNRLYHYLYGKWWPRDEPWDQTYIELFCFRHERTEAEGGLGKFGHLRECIDLLFNHDETDLAFDWNPWAIKLLQEACENDYLGVCGCASSCKSFSAAAWSIVNWLAAPAETMVLVTSTSITAAKKRVWGSIIRLWNRLKPEIRKVGKLKASTGIILYQPEDGSVSPDNCGISLIASEQKQEANAVGKLIGLKQLRVLMCADELPELSHSVNTAMDNLSSNPYFHVMALGNPKDQTDAFGVFVEPVNGWNSINEGTDEWESRLGKVIRFDILKSENYLTGTIVYPYMYSKEKVDKAMELYGEKSARFFRMFRGFFPVQGAEDVIFSDVDFNLYLKDSIEWGKEKPVKVAGFDPSFSRDGDRSILTICAAGRDATGVHCLQYLKHVAIKEDITDSKMPRTQQICKQIKQILDTEGILYRHFAFDQTGGGAPFGDVLSQMLSREVLGINFGGKASDRPVSATDRTPAFERYVNRCAELWYSMCEVLRGGQLAGFGAPEAKEFLAQMKVRHYETIKGTYGERIQVEPKKEMKLRTGRSPDEADSAMIILDLCRQRLHFTSQERGLAVLPKAQYIEVLKKFDITTLSNHNQPDWQAVG